MYRNYHTTLPVLETVPVRPRPAKRPRHASSLFLVGPYLPIIISYPAPFWALLGIDVAVALRAFLYTQQWWWWRRRRRRRRRRRWRWWTNFHFTLSINQSIIHSFICSVNTSNNKSLMQQKVYMSKTCQAHLSTYGSLTRTNKVNNLHKLTDSLNPYV